MIPIEAPPIREELFVTQTYDDTEYFRAFKPNGDHYQSVDCASGLRAHCGFDDQDGLGAPLFAMAAGTHYEIDKGSPFGIQSVVVPTGTDYAWFYAHQNRRTVKDGVKVKAGQQIGEMGTSGGVACHLHKSALQPKERGCWFNPGPALRAFKAQLLNPPQTEDEMLVLKDFVHAQPGQNPPLYISQGDYKTPLSYKRFQLLAGQVKLVLKEVHKTGEPLYELLNVPTWTEK